MENRVMEMNCNELVERVTDCLEEAIGPEALMRLLDHLQVCQGCDAYFNEILVTLKAMSKQPNLTLPADVEADLVAIYQDWVKETAT